MRQSKPAVTKGECAKVSQRSHVLSCAHINNNVNKIIQGYNGATYRFNITIIFPGHQLFRSTAFALCVDKLFKFILCVLGVEGIPGVYIMRLGVWKGYQVYILCVLGCGRDTRSIYYASWVWKGRKEYQVYIYSTIENIAVGRTTDLVPLKGY